MAPRPHNSGHYTLDACVASQFEQQARILCGLPLGAPTQHMPAVMINLLGDLWNGREPDWALFQGDPSVRLHLYGKKEARPGARWDTSAFWIPIRMSPMHAPARCTKS